MLLLAIILGIVQGLTEFFNVFGKPRGEVAGFLRPDITEVEPLTPAQLG